MTEKKRLTPLTDPDNIMVIWDDEEPEPEPKRKRKRRVVVR